MIDQLGLKRGLTLPKLGKLTGSTYWPPYLTIRYGKFSKWLLTDRFFRIYLLLFFYIKTVFKQES